MAVGEVLFDVIEGKYNLGGAPFNVGAHMTRLGNEGYILSSVGQDELGDRIFREAEALGVHTRFLYRHDHLPTGTVPVTFHDGEPDYEIREPVAWDELQADPKSLLEIPWALIAFGSLAQRSEHNQQYYMDLFEEVKADRIYFDCNLRQNFYNEKILRDSLQAADIAKFNKEEVEVISKLFYNREMDTGSFAEALARDFDIDIAVYTLGAEGAQAWQAGRLHSARGIRVKVKDTVGAGDAFSAGFLHSLIAGREVSEALEYGNRLGAFVASSEGAIPEYSDEIRAVFELNP